MSFNPKATPVYQKAVKIAKQNYDGMNDAEKQVAHKNMAVNDMNLPGYPVAWGGNINPGLCNVVHPCRRCECGGCAIRADSYRCPRCGQTVNQGE